MTREELTERMKELPNPPCRVNLIQQVYDIIQEEMQKEDAHIAELEAQNANLVAMLKAEREVRVNDEYLKGICERDTEIDKLKEQIENMKCCGNCGNDKCTSKYRGNSAYHRQPDGYACADNEDWVPRKEWPNKCFDCKHWHDDLKLCQFSMGDEDYWCRGRDWEEKE